jgi:hypothetical protein
MDSFPKDKTRQVEPKGPDTLEAIREALIADRRAKKLAAQSDGGSGEPAQSARDELNDTPDTAGRPAESRREELHDARTIAGNDDSVRQEFDNAPTLMGDHAESMGEEPYDLSSISPAEPPTGLSSRLARLRDPRWDGIGPTNTERFRLPPAEPVPDPSPQPSVVGNRNSGGKWLFARRMLRTAIGGLATIAVIAVAIAWLPSGRTDLFKGSRVTDLTADEASHPGGQTRQENATDPKSSDQMARTITTPQDSPKVTASDFAAMRRQVEDLAAKQDKMAGVVQPDQFKTMANDLAALRRQVNELASRQDEMADDIAKLQTIERSLIQKLGVHTRSHRK